VVLVDSKADMQTDTDRTWRDTDSTVDTNKTRQQINQLDDLRPAGGLSED